MSYLEYLKEIKIDETLICLGIDINKIPKSAESFVSLFNIEKDVAFKLKIIQSLNLAPAFLVSKIRNLRNRLEHYYELPDNKDVREALDIAELFLKTLTGMTHLPLTDFSKFYN